MLEAPPIAATDSGANIATSVASVPSRIGARPRPRRSNAQRREHQHDRNQRPVEYADRNESREHGERRCNAALDSPCEHDAEPQQHADRDRGNAGNGGLKPGYAEEVAVDYADHDHGDERAAEKPGERHRRADGAPQMLADKDGEVGGIDSGKDLAERIARHEFLLRHPTPHHDDLAMHPGADAAAKAVQAEPQEYAVKGEQRYALGSHGHG